MTRLCFGISSGPSEWCLISETLVDFATILINDKTWDPEKIYNPKKEIPIHPKYENKNIPIKNTKKILLNLPDEDSYMDGYIDNLLSIILEYKRLILRAVHAVPLMCYQFFRPVHPLEPISWLDNRYQDHESIVTIKNCQKNTALKTYQKVQSTT